MIDFRKNNNAKINSVYNPDEKVQFDREQVYKRYSYMKAARSINGENLEALWNKWEKNYEAWRPSRSDTDWQSNIVPPFTTTIVERCLAELIDQTMWPVIRGRGPEDVPKAKVLTYVKDYTWEVGNGDLQLYSAIKEALVLGKTVWREDYWQDKRQVRQLKKFNLETNEEEYEEKDIYDFDDVYGQKINLRNFFIDPMASTINMGRNKANDCIERIIMNFDTFQENHIGSIWDQFGVAKLVKPGGDTNYYQFYQPPDGMDRDNQVEVLYYWGRRPDKFIIVANDVVIRDGPNPYNHKQLPYAEGSDIHRLNGFWANGEPKLLESIQDEMTTLRRMRVDRQHMDLFKMFLVSNRETLDEDEAIVAPSRFLYVDDPNNSIKTVEYGDINPSAYQEENALRQDGREVTGIESPQPAGTATQAAIFKESTMKSLRMKIWLLSRELLTNIIRLRVPNIVQYYSVPKVANIVGEAKMPQYRQITTENIALETTREGKLVEKKNKGENFFIVKPEMIVPQYGSYDFKLSGEPTFPISKPLQQQMVREFMQHPVFMSAVEAGYYDVGKAADVLSEINDFDPDKFKKTDQEQQQSQIVDQQELLELANRENELILQGQRLKPTAYSNRQHTDVHLAFMSSPDFQQTAGQDQNIMANMVYHVQGEEVEQASREQGATQEGFGGDFGSTSVGKGIMKSEAKAAMPGRMLGQESVPGKL
jgi:hypothetical protein